MLFILINNLLIYLLLFVDPSRGSACPEARWKIHVLRVQQSHQSCSCKVSRIIKCNAVYDWMGLDV